MMGLRTMTVAATEAGGALRRIILLATVAALMAVMLVMSAAPAAYAHQAACKGNGLVTSQFVYQYADDDGDGYVCVYEGKNKTRVTDDHGMGGH